MESAKIVKMLSPEHVEAIEKMVQAEKAIEQAEKIRKDALTLDLEGPTA